MTMSARYCQKCGTAMRYMDYGPPEFRCWGMACPNCESRREEARALMDAERKKSREAKAKEPIPEFPKLTDQEKREAEQEAAEKLLKAIEELPEDEEKQL